MTTWQWVGLAAIGVFGLLSAWSPRRLWRHGIAWAFKHPGALEPSDALYGVWRLMGWAVLIGALVYPAANWSKWEHERKERFLEPSREAVDRGEVPLSGFSLSLPPSYGSRTEGKRAGEVEVWSPYSVDPDRVDSHVCHIDVDLEGTGNGVWKFQARLKWRPYKVGDLDADEYCDVDKLRGDKPSKLFQTMTTAAGEDQVVLTDGPVIECDKANGEAWCGSARPQPARKDAPLPKLDEYGAPAQE